MMQMADKAAEGSFVRWLGAVHSDFFPALEYVAPRGFFVGSVPNGARWLDRRTEAPANAKLWLQAYLGGRPPARDDLRDAYALAVRYRSIYENVAGACARKWYACYPDDPEARGAYSASAAPGFSAAAAALWPTSGVANPLDFDVGKTSCRYRMNDYLAQRNCLGLPDDDALARHVRELTSVPQRPADPEALLWDGILSYDRGDYEHAGRSLRQALSFTRSGPGPMHLSVGFFLCRTLMAAGRHEDACEVAEELARAFPENLQVVLLRSEARGAIGEAAGR
jgi:tetratricopeptide (TPR) repeat protein